MRNRLSSRRLPWRPPDKDWLSVSLSLWLSFLRRSEWEPPEKKVDTRKYRAEPRSIFDYEPGKSSVLKLERTVTLSGFVCVCVCRLSCVLPFIIFIIFPCHLCIRAASLLTVSNTQVYCIYYKREKTKPCRWLTSVQQRLPHSYRRQQTLIALIRITNLIFNINCK